MTSFFLALFSFVRPNPLLWIFNPLKMFCTASSDLGRSRSLSILTRLVFECLNTGDMYEYTHIFISLYLYTFMLNKFEYISCTIGTLANEKPTSENGVRNEDDMYDPPYVKWPVTTTLHIIGYALRFVNPLWVGYQPASQTQVVGNQIA